MAKLVLTDVNVTIGAVNYSANINQVEISLSADSVDTSFGSAGGWRTETAGLKSGTFTVSLHTDYAASGIDSSLYALFGTQATVVVLPNGTAVSASNPSYTFVANITNITPVSGAVGDLAVANLTFPITGPVTRGTV